MDQTEKELFTGVWCTQNLLEILNNNLGPKKKIVNTLQFFKPKNKRMNLQLTNKIVFHQ